MTNEDIQKIKKKMKYIGVTNMSAFIRKMAIDGYYVNLQINDLKELVYLLRMCSNNLNQYAKKANGTDCIYLSDIKDLQVRLNQIWEMTRNIMDQLSKIS